MIIKVHTPKMATTLSVHQFMSMHMPVLHQAEQRDINYRGLVTLNTVCVFVHAYSIALPIAEVRRDSGGLAKMADPLFHHRGTLHSLGGIHL